MIHEPRSISRRSWLLGTLAVSALGAAPGEGNPQLEAIRERGRKARMEGFDESESAHYLGIGDAPKRFREAALEICEAVAADYRKHFTEKGFELTTPPGKLTVVILLGPKSYAMFEGGFVDDAIGGHFDLDENRLVMFDFRGPGANPRHRSPSRPTRSPSSTRLFTSSPSIQGCSTSRRTSRSASAKDWPPMPKPGGFAIKGRSA